MEPRCRRCLEEIGVKVSGDNIYIQCRKHALEYLILAKLATKEEVDAFAKIIKEEIDERHQPSNAD